MNDQPSDMRVVYLPGMQGNAPGDRWLVRGLIDAGLTDTTMYDWTGFRWPLNNLRDRQLHRRAGEALAHRITDDCEQNARAHRVLVSHSTGAMVILEALALLDMPRVDQVWFLSAAVSRTWDLRPALGGTRRLVNLYSSWDWLVLNLGTRVFGTADGPRCPCAGFAPFIGPGCDDPRLQQRAYDRSWWTSGHFGGHLGPIMLLGGFARKILAPMLLATQQELDGPIAPL